MTLCTTAASERCLDPDFFIKFFDMFIRGLIKLQSMNFFQVGLCQERVRGSSYLFLLVTYSMKANEKARGGGAAASS